MKIVVGYDGSKAADDAIKIAQKHAKAFEAEVYVLTFLEHRPLLKTETIDQAKSKLEKLKKAFTENAIACEVNASVSYMSPGENLVKFAKENDADEVIIGVRKRSPVGKAVFGSTAQYVILNSPCSVTAAK
ncbi:MAG: universal stress protein [Desulfobacterales bacterium]|jgi:nucleotide-binding universal stress UspA family protein